MTFLDNINIEEFVPNNVSSRVLEKKTDGKFADGLSQIVFNDDNWKDLWDNIKTRKQSIWRNYIF